MLRRFVEDGSQEAFGQLVQRHINLVYSVCRRETGDETLAEDVTQAVFLILARKAASIREGTPITGWLFKTSRFAVRNALRQERRREAAEREVIAEMTHQGACEETWRAIEPLLHDGIASLKEKDREVILLRYFEGKTLQEVGQFIGLSENAAHMRIDRAIEKLKLYLKKHGVTVTVVLLAPLLAEKTALAVPSSCASAVTVLAANVTSAGIGAAGTAVIGSKVAAISKGVLKMMFLNNVKVATVVVGLSLAGASGVRALQGADNPGAPSVPPTSGSPRQVIAEARETKPMPEAERDLESINTALFQYVIDANNTLPAMTDSDTVAKAIRGYYRDDSIFDNSETGQKYQPNTSLSKRKMETLKEGGIVLFYDPVVSADKKRWVLVTLPAVNGDYDFSKGRPVRLVDEKEWEELKKASGIVEDKQATSDPAQKSKMNLKQVGLAARQWLADNNEKVTFTTKSWQQELKPYVKDEIVFYADDAMTQPFSFNGNLTGLEEKDAPETVVALTSTVMFYQGKDEKLDFVYEGRGLVCFFDGHVSLVSPEKAKSLIWKPQVSEAVKAKTDENKQAAGAAALGNMTKLKQVSLGAAQYLADYDNKFTFRSDSWLEALKPYVKSDVVFYADDAKQQPFTFNGKLIGSAQNNIAVIAETIMFYQGKDEKLDFVYNGYGIVCFVDGHVALVSPDEAKTLIWQPIGIRQQPVGAGQ